MSGIQNAIIGFCIPDIEFSNSVRGFYNPYMGFSSLLQFELKRRCFWLKRQMKPYSASITTSWVLCMVSFRLILPLEVRTN